LKVVKANKTNKKMPQPLNPIDSYKMPIIFNSP